MRTTIVVLAILTVIVAVVMLRRRRPVVGGSAGATNDSGVADALPKTETGLIDSTADALAKRTVRPAPTVVELPPFYITGRVS